MTAPKLTGLTVLRDAALQAAPVIHVLILDDVPRTGLTPREVAKVTGLTYWRVREEIKAGRIRVITGGRDYIIPVSELAEIVKWAHYLDPTA